MKHGREPPTRVTVTLPTRMVKTAGEYHKGDRHMIDRNSRGRTRHWSRQTVTLTCGHQVTLVDKPPVYAKAQRPKADDFPNQVPCAICYSEGKTK